MCLSALSETTLWNSLYGTACSLNVNGYVSSLDVNRYAIEMVSGREVVLC